MVLKHNKDLEPVLWMVPISLTILNQWVRDIAQIFISLIYISKNCYMVYVNKKLSHWSPTGGIVKDEYRENTDLRNHEVISDQYICMYHAAVFIHRCVHFSIPLWTALIQRLWPIFYFPFHWALCVAQTGPLTLGPHSVFMKWLFLGIRGGSLVTIIQTYWKMITM